MSRYTEASEPRAWPEEQRPPLRLLTGRDPRLGSRGDAPLPPSGELLWQLRFQSEPSGLCAGLAEADRHLSMAAGG